MGLDVYRSLDTLWAQRQRKPPVPARRRHPNGFLPFDHDLLEAIIRYPFTRGETQVLLILLRLTAGWHRPTCRIAHQALAHLTHLSRRQVLRIVESLLQHSAIARDRRTRPFTYRVNQIYFGWRDWPQVAARDRAIQGRSADETEDADCDTAGAVGGATSGTPYKERKEKEQTASTAEPGP